MGKSHRREKDIAPGSDDSIRNRHHVEDVPDQCLAFFGRVWSFAPLCEEAWVFAAHRLSLRIGTKMPQPM